MEILAQSWYKISEELYKNTGGGDQGGPQGGNPMDDIINNMNNNQ